MYLKPSVCVKMSGWYLKIKFDFLSQRPGPGPGVRWVFLYMDRFLFLNCFILQFVSAIGQCRSWGVLDDQSGPVPEHQHHVHPLSESTRTSRTGSQHQVHRCMMSLHHRRSVTCLTLFLPPLPVCGSLTNGSAALITVGNASRSEFIKHLKRYNSSSGQVRVVTVRTR